MESFTANDIKKGREKVKRVKYWMVFAISFTDQKMIDESSLQHRVAFMTP